jgi:aromatic-L-amino-acid/L-tryptophan decarboxylase
MQQDHKMLGDMPADEFRRHGHALIDWIANYFERIGEYPVLSQIEPGWLKDSLPKSAPETDAVS